MRNRNYTISPEGRVAQRAAGTRTATRLNWGTISLTPKGRNSKFLEGKILGSTYGPHTVKHMRTLLTHDVLVRAGQKTASSFSSEHQVSACKRRNQIHGSPLKNPAFQRLGSAIGQHVRWHVNRSVVKLGCSFCQESL